MTTDAPFPVDRPVRSASRSLARFLPAVARLLLGLLFLVFGLNGFLNFIPPPKAPLPPGAAAFVSALFNSGYMFQLVSGTQLLVGVLLLVNRFVPLALVLIAPVIVNIIAFHVFLAPAGIALGVLALVLEIYLVWAYRRAYRPLFTARVTPGER